MAAPPTTFDKIPLDKDLPSFYPNSPVCTLSVGAPDEADLRPSTSVPPAMSATIDTGVAPQGRAGRRKSPRSGIPTDNGSKD